MVTAVAARENRETCEYPCTFMQDGKPSLRKVERQRLIASIVTRKPIGTQQEVIAALAAAGCDVTQATVSRDIRELGLEKRHDPLGRPRYALRGERERGLAPLEALTRVVREFGRRATAAQNVVVLHSELGSAPAIARALDRLAHPKIVGTLAGDDTCLLITHDARDARAVATELAQWLED